MAAAKSELDPGRCRRCLPRHRGEPPQKGRTDDRSFQSPQIRRVGDWQSRIRLGNGAIYKCAKKIGNAGAGCEHNVRWKTGRLMLRFATSVRKGSAIYR